MKKGLSWFITRIHLVWSSWSLLHISCVKPAVKNLKMLHTPYFHVDIILILTFFLNYDFILAIFWVSRQHLSNRFFEGGPNPPSKTRLQLFCFKHLGMFSMGICSEHSFQHFLSAYCWHSLSFSPSRQLIQASRVIHHHVSLRQTHIHMFSTATEQKWGGMLCSHQCHGGSELAKASWFTLVSVLSFIAHMELTLWFMPALTAV